MRIVIILIFILNLSEWNNCCLAQDSSSFAIQRSLEQAKAGEIEQAFHKISSIKDSSAYYFAVKGEILMLYGRYDEAIQLLQLSLDKFEREGINKDPKAIHTHSNLAILYWNQGKSEAALDELFFAFSLCEKDMQGLIADIKNNIGLVYSTSSSEQAISYYQEALSFYEKDNAYAEKQAQTMVNIALQKIKEENNKSALSQLNQALDIIEKKYGKEHTTAAFILSNLGKIYADMGDEALSTFYFDESLKILKQIYGQKHPEIANVYSLKGDLTIQKKEYKKALQAYQNAIIANSFLFDDSSIETLPPSNDVMKALSMIFILSRKANALEQYYHGFSLKNTHLNQALEALFLADSLIQQSRYGIINKQDELLLNELSFDIYEQAQSVALQLSKGSIRKKHYTHLAFLFSEKSKSAALINALNESNAKSFAGIPDEILRRENDIKSKISFYELQLASKSDAKEQENIRLKLALTKQDLYDFQAYLSNEYPDFFELKNRTELLEVHQLLEKLSPHEMIMSYNFNDAKKQLIIYQITKKGIQYQQYNNADYVRRLIRGYRNTLRYKLKNEFIQLSSEMYSILFPFKIPSNISHLYIIGQSEISKIPFEALLYRKNTASNYALMPYLNQRYSISYNFSVNLIYRKKEKLDIENNAFIYAPVYFNESIELNNLLASESEANAIYKGFTETNRNAKLIVKDEAVNFNAVSQNLSNYRFIHLATHAKVDEDQPDLSRLYMGHGSKKDILYANEIYNWSINAQLICLSACETGLGKLSKSEGLIGLGRAFSFAGAENVIVSLWPVADESTSQLMSTFYQELLESEQELVISKALQAAKMELISGNRYSAPYYWAPFILIGK